MSKENVIRKIEEIMQEYERFVDVGSNGIWCVNELDFKNVANVVYDDFLNKTIKKDKK